MPQPLFLASNRSSRAFRRGRKCYPCPKDPATWGLSSPGERILTSWRRRCATPIGGWKSSSVRFLTQISNHPFHAPERVQLTLGGLRSAEPGLGESREPPREGSVASRNWGVGTLA